MAFVDKEKSSSQSGYTINSSYENYYNNQNKTNNSAKIDAPSEHRPCEETSVGTGIEISSTLPNNERNFSMIFDECARRVIKQPAALSSSTNTETYASRAQKKPNKSKMRSLNESAKNDLIVKKLLKTIDVMNQEMSKFYFKMFKKKINFFFTISFYFDYFFSKTKEIS
jgi:hypothetical protein